MSLGLPRASAPKRLVSGEEDDEEPEGLDADSFMQQLSESETVHPSFRWRRSRWGRFCPVQLAEGNMVLGRREFSVGYVPCVSVPVLGQYCSEIEMIVLLKYLIVDLNCTLPRAETN